MTHLVLQWNAICTTSFASLNSTLGFSFVLYFFCMYHVTWLSAPISDTTMCVQMTDATLFLELSWYFTCAHCRPHSVRLYTLYSPCSLQFCLFTRDRAVLCYLCFFITLAISENSSSKHKQWFMLTFYVHAEIWNPFH